MNTYSNFYSRVQNAQRIGDPIVHLPWSHKIWRFAIILKRLKYIENFEVNTENSRVNNKKFPTISLYLIPGGFSSLRQLSKPSRRVYKKARNIEVHKRPYGSFIISTNFGLLSCHEARAMNIGGELMCEIY
ncbi:MAG: 30S ribosomal protein S8 [Rickettsiales bacterium]|nr:30S ribosomal protein S8 [Rickettsiales bacterium]